MDAPSPPPIGMTVAPISGSFVPASRMVPLMVRACTSAAHATATTAIEVKNSFLILEII